MPVFVRRVLYGLLALLGFAMMVPFTVNMRRLQAQLAADPTAFGMNMSPADAEWISRLTGLFVLGALLAAGFLYAALSTGYAKAWRPAENGTPRCRRCDSDIGFGLSRCPTCDQQLTW
jgi:hypothetical protein